MNDRRDTLKIIGLGAMGIAGVMVTPSVSAQSLAESTPIRSAFSADTKIKPIGFKPDQLDGISEKVITSQWENNYAGSVRALNIIKARLDAALLDENMAAFVYNDLKREHLMRTGSVILHELYFENLTPKGGRNSELDRILKSAFGSVSNWEKEFRLIASGLGGGSGWVTLAWNHQLKALENYWMADHMHCPVNASPILVMDMYEHSYHMDYGAAAGQYIDAFLRNVNWEIAAQRLSLAIR